MLFPLILSLLVSINPTVSPASFNVTSPVIAAVKQADSLGGMVSLDHWNTVEQEFILEYMAKFLSDSVQGPETARVEMEQALYDQESTQLLIDNAQKVCQGQTSDLGQEWDNFVENLDSFPPLCSQ